MGHVVVFCFTQKVSWDSLLNENPINALVTGGAGFIGSHLVERLLSDGHRVTVIDSFVCGSRENLAGVAHNPRLSVHEADVVQHEAIRPLFEGVDWVFHLAALADIVPSIQHPVRYHQANVDGTVSVLEAARAADVKRFVYAASSSCYGVPDDFRLTIQRTANQTSPISRTRTITTPPTDLLAKVPQLVSTVKFRG